MKIPGKLPFQTIVKKLPQSTDVDKIFNVQKNIVSVNTKEIVYKKSKKSFSVKVLNYIEPFLFKGQRYTLFYTEVDHNLKVGDRVFITGGQYDSDLIIQSNKFSKLSDGYIVQYVDRTKVVLDIEYTGDLPFVEEPIDNFIKVYVVSEQSELNYYLQNFSSRDFKTISNKFSWFGTYSTNNLLYLNGTFSIIANNYGVKGFDEDNLYTSYGNAFLRLAGTQSGYLEDMNYYVNRQRKIVSSTITVFGLNTFILLTTDLPHNVPTLKTVVASLSDLVGTGAYLSLDNININFTSISSNVLYGLVSGSYASTITDGVITPVNIKSSYPLSFRMNGNDNLKIINQDFTHNGVEFKKDYTYYYDVNALRYKVERKFLNPIINEQNFRNGFFKSGEFNQGLLGTHQETIDYSGQDVKFTLGTVLNVNWEIGNVGSGVGSDESYYTSFDEFGLPQVKINDKNNSGLGYNYFYDSYIKIGTILNGSFYENIIGSESNTKILNNYYKNISTTYSVNIKKGNYYNNEITNSSIINSSIFGSKVENSNITNSKSANSEIHRSLFYKSKFISDKVIKIEGYDEKSIFWWRPGAESQLFPYKLFKFYISDESFKKLKNFRNFYITDLSFRYSGNSIETISNILEYDKFTIDSYYETFDRWWANKGTRKTIVQLSSPEDNKYIPIGITNSVELNNFAGYASIDILMQDNRLSIYYPGQSNLIYSYVGDFNSKVVNESYGPYIFNLNSFTNNVSWNSTSSVVQVNYSGGSPTISGTFSFDILGEELNKLLIGTWTYSGVTFSIESTSYVFDSLSYEDATDLNITTVFSTQSTQKVYREYDIVDISRSYISDSDFVSGLFLESTWINGNYLPYNRDNSFIKINNSDFYSPVTIDNSLGEFEISAFNNARKEIFSTDDILFTNALYYSNTAGGADNLVKMPSVYEIGSIISGGGGRTFTLKDPIYGTSSILYNIPSVTGQSVLITKYAKNHYNYLHPVRFEKSKIQSGIFRRAYFENCEIHNPLFNLEDKDPINFSNWKSLLLNDIIFADNSNNIKSGAILYSHFTSGSDKWTNGIFSRSIWNVQSFTWSNYATGSNYNTTNLNKFENGIFKYSTWIDGVFSNGLFYKNNSNQVLKSDVYSNKTNAYYVNRRSDGFGYVRYSWQNGQFENGRFELSNWENGTFSNGDFYNSNFFSGNAYGGNFGKKNLKFDSTKVLSGSFSNLNVISAEFKTENPTGAGNGNFSIDWYNGIFNNGYFGVKIHPSTYSELGQAYNFNSTWYDGTFNNGNFADIAVWKDGEFNSGKFLSYYGYPWTTAASYSSAGQEYFSWQNGEFNGGEFGNASIGTNSTWYNGNFNGGVFTARVWMNGSFTKGWFLGSGTISTSLSNIPEFLSSFSDDFYGLWYNGNVLENKKVDLSNKKRIFTKLEREFTKKRKKLSANFKNILWKGGTFSHNDGIFENSVWLDGNFNRGRFYLSSFNPYANYIINGNFQKPSENSVIEFWEDQYTDYEDQTEELIGSFLEVVSSAQYTNDLSKKLNLSGTSSIVNLYQTAGLIVGETYTLKAVVLENYNNEIRFGNSIVSLRNRNFTESLTSTFSSWVLASTSSTTLPTFNVTVGSPGYIEYTAGSVDSISFLIYPDILIPGQNYTCKFYTHDEVSFTNPYVGSCDSSLVSIESGILQSSFVENTSITYSVPFGNSNEYQITFVAAYKDLVIYTVPNTISTSYKATSFILTGNENVLTSSDVTSRTSYSYAFTAEDSNFSIEFIPKADVQVNDVPTWQGSTCSIYSLEVVKGSVGFNTSDSCVWKGGVLDQSEFYISKWETGKWLTGTAVGMIWKNGVANYMNAYNVYWEGGTWRNGNWNGSPFNYENVNPNGCLLTYGTNASLSLSSPFNNLDLANVPYSGESRIYVHTYGNGASFSFNDSTTSGNNFYDTWQDPELDPDSSGNFVSTVGLPFLKSTTPNQFTIGNRYKVTISVGTVSVADQTNLSKVGLQFSIGKPGSESALYGEATGTYEGSLYSGLRETAAGLDFVSGFYQLTNLENHTGTVVPDLLVSGVDGYLSSVGGQISEVLTSRDDGKLYLHISAYGVSGFYIDSISVQEESCTPRIEVNDGYVSDILTNISIYKLSKQESDYRDIFINDAFTVSIDPSYAGIAGQPNLTLLSFTWSNFGSKWSYATSYDTYGLINCSNSPFQSSPPGTSFFSNQAYAKAVNTNQNTNFYIDKNTSVYLRAIDSSGSQALFTSLGEYDIEIEYIMQYGPTTSVPIVNGQSTYLLNGEFQVRVGYSQGINNGGYIDSVSKTFRLYKIGCVGINWFGSTSVLTYKSTFEPTLLGSISTDLEKLLIKKIATIPGVRIHILSCRVVKKNSRYDPQYNNATYSIFDNTPAYSDSLFLPVIDLIGGQSNGNLISTRFGNGMFTSGTASAFSSIWENGVWNDGYRMDRYMYVFENFGFFSGTAKPYAFSGEIITKKSNIGVIPSIKDRNVTLTKVSKKSWIITLRRKKGILYFESQTLDQNNTYIADYFKIGDKVSVGNIVALDINDRRRVIRDYFTVVDLDEELIYLQITLNFPVRRISKDSEQHLIYITKNIWLSGAFLNGKFRGVWSNGLFKGRPYITKMIDSQWIDGRFDGGTFKGLTMSAFEDISEDNNEELEIEYFNSGLIQNFNFKDNNVLPAPGFKYNSWLDINWYNTEAVALNKNNYQTRPSASEAASFQFTENNFYGYPTIDILSSISTFRNTYNDLSSSYRLGYAIEKYEQLIPFDGEFKRSFDATYKYPGTKNFLEMGFTYSESANKIMSGGYIGEVLYRFRSNTSLDTSGIFRVSANNYAHATDAFGVEDGYGIRLDNVETEVDFGNYTMIEFSLNYIGATFNNYGGQLQFPINLYSGLTSFGGPSPYSLIDPLTIYDNTSGYPSTYSYQGVVATNFSGQFFTTIYTQSYPLNHLLNPSRIKREYFYNRPEINFWFTELAYGDNPDYLYEFDYIKYWTVDQIPFFRYATESRINQSILAPYSSIAPFIDYTDNEFSLIDSINITETVFETVTNPIVSVSSGGTSVIDELSIKNIISGLLSGSFTKIPPSKSYPTKTDLVKITSPGTTNTTNSSSTSTPSKGKGD
jgi:hypothetical protein